MFACASPSLFTAVFSHAPLLAAAVVAGGADAGDAAFAQGPPGRIVVRSPHFALMPLMLAQTQLVLTTGRLFCQRYLDSLPLRIVRCPVNFPSMTYYQLWHDVSHNAASLRWLRETVRDVARTLGSARTTTPPNGRAS